MRFFMFVSLVLVLMMGILMAGGIVTNTNQSAAYMRTLNRNASTDVDAVYFNPAGLTALEDGLHLSLSNQSIWQTKTVNNDYANLSNNEFVGDVVAPLFPNLYIAYKSGKLALSAGFEPIGGGGSAVFEDGLPSFEIPVSNLKTSLGVSDYSFDTKFEGSSIYFGGQVGISYAINNMISVGVGARYVMASNSYLGHMKDIMVNSAAGWTTPVQYLEVVVAQFQSASASLQSIIDAGAGGSTLSDLQAGGYLTAEEYAQLAGGLTSLGVTDPGSYTAAVAQATYDGAATSTQAQIPYVQAATADVEVDAKQTGSGISPVVSLFLTPGENLGIAMRYEMKTPLELENDTKEDGTGLFPDGAKTNADMPAMFALGVSYKAMKKLRAEFDLNYYFNEGVDWDGKEDYIENGYEAGLAVEYCLNEKMRASVGFLNAKGGAKEDYQTDMSYSLNSNTIGFGFAYKLADNILLNVGALNTFYGDDEKNTDTYKETYKKTTFGFAFGIDYKF